MENIRVGACYNVLDVKSDGFLCVDWDKDKSIGELGSYRPWRFCLVEQFPEAEENSAKLEYRELLEHGIRTGIAYGVLFERIPDSDEDLWEIAEKIVGALGKAEENL